MSRNGHFTIASEIIFVSGSRSIKSLPASARERLHEHLATGAHILVGDAPGVDLLVQQYLANVAYQDVTVCHIGPLPRNNVGFQAQRIEGTRQVDKDIYMAKAADRGLAIWDGKSPGTKQNISRLQTVVITPPAPASTRGEQARADILAQSSEDFRSLYNVPEGLTRGQHTTTLHHLDQFARDEFERGATVTDAVLSIPRDPDSRLQDNSTVRIGSESHAIRFVSGFIKDTEQALATGHRLYELAEKACGQWTDTHGRWQIFTNIYDLVRKDENGLYRTNDQKAAVIEQVLNSLAAWAEQLPEPTPEPSAEEVHQYTLELAKENKREVSAPEIEEPVPIDRLVESNARLLYRHELETNSHGLTTIGELTGFTLEDPHSDLIDENQVYSDLYEAAVLDALDFSTPEGDHRGAKRVAGAGPVLDATFERVNLDALPPALPVDLSEQTQAHLVRSLLPSIDARIDRGLSRHEILSAIYQDNRINEAQRFNEQVGRAYGIEETDAKRLPVSREDQLRALTSLRLLLAAEYKRETRGYTREALDWAKGNYRSDPDQLRAAGKLKVGEYSRLLNDRTAARSNWRIVHEGQQVPYRTQVQRISVLETAGHKVNNRITAINPSREELLNALQYARATLFVARNQSQTRLTAFANTDAALRDVTLHITDHTQHVRNSDQFATAKSLFIHNEHERAIDEQQAAERANNARFAYLSGAHGSAFAEIRQEHETERQAERASLINSLINPQLESKQQALLAELRDYQRYFTQLARREIATPAEAREALQPTLSNLDSVIAVADRSTNRLDPNAKLSGTQNLTPAPIYISLVSNEHLRIPISTLPEYDALTNAIRDCRLETATWRSLNTPAPVTGRDEERDTLTTFIGDYIDFRQSDYVTAELNRDRVFREYAQRLNDTRTTDELVQTVVQISRENFDNYQRAEVHRLDPAAVSVPDKAPLSLGDMRQLFLSVTPAVADKSTRAEMRNILLSTLFGKDKTDRVQLLADGKIKPSPTLSKLLDNLAGRSTIAAVNHFYASLRNPSPARANTFNLYEAHRSLPQYERDFLHQRALAAKYESFKDPDRSVLSLRSGQLPLAPNSNEPTIAETAKATASYRSYYGQADWREAQLCAAALQEQNRTSHGSQVGATSTPEFSDLEVRTLSYAVHNFDSTRQSQIVEYLRGTDDLHNQTVADMLLLAADGHRAGATQQLTAADIQLPKHYSVSSESAQRVVNFALQDNRPPLDPAKAAELRQSAQREAWTTVQQTLLKDSSLFVDAPVKVINEVRHLQQLTVSAAQLQERARTAFAVRDAHLNYCVEKAKNALRTAAVTSSPDRLNFASTPSTETTRELISLALDRNRPDSKGLVKNYHSEFQLVKSALSQSDIERANQLQQYATTARDQYLRLFPKLDAAKSSLNQIESQLAQQVAARYEEARQHVPSASERFTAVKDAVERHLLGEHLVELLTDQKDLSSATSQNTASELLPVAVANQVADSAREQAWQSFEPQEIRDANAGQVVDERLLDAAYLVMDHVALARDNEKDLRGSEHRLNFFVDQKSGERGTLGDPTDTTRTETLGQLKDTDAARYKTLKQDVEKAKNKLASAFQQIDSTLERLAITRAELRVEKQLAQYQQIATPAAERINVYLKETTKEEGLKAVIEPVRQQTHVERIALTILQTARDCNVQLGHSPDGLAQVHTVASNLFDTLRDGMERANHHLLQGREVTAETHRSDQILSTQQLHHHQQEQTHHLNTHDRIQSQPPANIDKAATRAPDRVLDLRHSRELLSDNPFYEQNLANSLDLTQQTQPNNSGSQTTAFTQNQQAQERESQELDLVL